MSMPPYSLGRVASGLSPEPHRPISNTELNFVFDAPNKITLNPACLINTPKVTTLIYDPTPDE